LSVPEPAQQPENTSCGNRALSAEPQQGSGCATPRQTPSSGSGARSCRPLLGLSGAGGASSCRQQPAKLVINAENKCRHHLHCILLTMLAAAPNWLHQMPSSWTGCFGNAFFREEGKREKRRKEIQYFLKNSSDQITFQLPNFLNVAGLALLSKCPCLHKGRITC